MDEIMHRVVDGKMDEGLNAQFCTCPLHMFGQTQIQLYVTRHMWVHLLFFARVDNGEPSKSKRLKVFIFRRMKATSFVSSTLLQEGELQLRIRILQCRTRSSFASTAPRGNRPAWWCIASFCSVRRSACCERKGLLLLLLLR